MPYTAITTRANPTCLVFLVDQSGSMEKPFGRQPERRKADGVADVVNRFLSEVSIKSAKAEGIRDYLKVGVIGYGEKVGPVLGGVLAGKPLLWIGEIANNPLRIEDRTRTEDDGTGGVFKRTVKVPVWLEPRAGGKTPIAQALVQAREAVEGFLRAYPDCFPPVVINITDGIPSEDPRPEAQKLCELASSDGRVLLFNIHVSEKPDRPIEFPAAEDGLPDKFAKLLFRISSVLPPPFVKAAESEDFAVTPQSRGFVFNGDLISVIKFFNIGTLPAQEGKPKGGK